MTERLIICIVIAAVITGVAMLTAGCSRHYPPPINWVGYQLQETAR